MRCALSILLFICPSSSLKAQTQSADSAWAIGDYPTARARYQAALTQDPGSVRSLYRLSILLAWDGKLDSSLTLLRYARIAEPEEPDVRFQQATVLSWKGDFRAALSKWDSLIALAPERRDARYGKAQALSWAGRMKEADSVYAALAESDRSDMNANAGRGQVAAWSGDYAKAAEYYQDVLARDPENVNALVGLAQVRQWQGRPAEAEPLVAKAIAIAPTDRSAVEAQRSIRAIRRPKLNLELGWSHDSDKNTLWWQTVGASMLLTSGVRGFASAGVAEATDPLREGTRLSAEAGASIDQGNVNLTGALGVRSLSSDGFDSRTLGTWRAAASARVTQHAGVGISYSHYSFDETALLLGRDLDIDEVSVDGDIEPRPGLSIGAGLGKGWLSDDNQRSSAILAVTQRVARRFTVGLLGRALGYDDPGIGYFAPDRFLLGEGRGAFTYGVRRWEARISGGLGLQQIGKGSTAQSEWHAEVRGARRWSIDNEVALSAGISNSAESSTTGAFRYYTATLTVRLGL